MAGDLKVKAIVFENDVLTAENQLREFWVTQIVNEKNCDVLFSRKKVLAIDRSTRKETIIGKKKSKDKLWQTVEGNESKGSERSKALSTIRSAAHLAISNTTDADYVRFSLVCFGNTPISTLSERPVRKDGCQRTHG